MKQKILRLILASELFLSVISFPADSNGDLNFDDSNNDNFVITTNKREINTFNFCNDCACGVNKISRVVNGTIADPKEFPWSAAIIYEGRHKCGASLITRRHVITAAHCVFEYSIKDFTVRLQDNSSYKIISIHLPKNYVTSNKSNDDIALVELDQPVKDVSTVCLPNEEKSINFSGIGTVIGWGNTEEQGLLSNELRKVDLPIIPKEECLKLSGYSEDRINDKVFCAGYPDGTQDSCYGDSGGPFHLMDSTGTMEIVGLVSFGRGCARPGSPGVYTKVSSFRNWIAKNLKTSCVCPSPVARED